MHTLCIAVYIYIALAFPLEMALYLYRDTHKLVLLCTDVQRGEQHKYTTFMYSLGGVHCECEVILVKSVRVTRRISAATSCQWQPALAESMPTQPPIDI